MCACKPVCVKRKSPIQSPVSVCVHVGEGEHSFTLSRWETPLPLLWWWHNLHILPSSILFFLLPPEKLNRGRRILELRGKSAKAQPKAAACLQAQHRGTDMNAVQ